MSQSLIATYGHGTENDFVLVFDPTDEISITTAQTAAICNRETGIGADGLIRIIKRDEKWFMDYRNADGSIAEMCGNGIRVMARYLVQRGHQAEGIFAINTRDGLKHLRVPATDDISVNMGKVLDENEEITASVEGKIWNGYNINVGNPHAVVFVERIENVGDDEKIFEGTVAIRTGDQIQLGRLINLSMTYGNREFISYQQCGRPSTLTILTDEGKADLQIFISGD